MKEIAKSVGDLDVRIAAMEIAVDEMHKHLNRLYVERGDEASREFKKYHRDRRKIAYYNMPEIEDEDITYAFDEKPSEKKDE